MINIKLTGFDELDNNLEEMQSFMTEIHGDIQDFEYNAEDLESINQAISHMENTLDEKARKYQHNSTIMELVENLKEKYKQQILDIASLPKINHID